jgi:predicted protein tyrosine phosphatase
MILIAPLSKTSDLLTQAGVTHAMSLLSPGSVFPELALDAARHLRLEFHDIAEERQGYQAPSLAQMESILRFVGDWDRKGAMLIHCWAGVSRSTASAYAAMCLLHRQADEFALAAELRAASPEATPNPRLVAHADDILGRKGRMVEAIAALGRGADCMEGSVVRWKLR